MKDLTSTILAAAIKQREKDKPYVKLLEVTLPDYQVVRLANHDRDISFEFDSDGKTAHVWHAFPFTIDGIRETKAGDLPQFTIEVGNQTLEFMGFVDSADGLTDQDVRLLIVNTEDLLDTSARVLFAGTITATEAGQDSIKFTLGRPNLSQTAFPARRCLSTCSVLRFGDDECGYVIPDDPGESIGTGFSSCPGRTLDECRDRGDDEVARGLERQHPRRFQGFPGIRSGNP